MIKIDRLMCLSPIQRSRWPRGRVLGGTSVINANIYCRGNRLDYDLWAKNGAIGWSWREVFPYFLKSEDNRDPNMAYNGEFATFLLKKTLSFLKKTLLTQNAKCTSSLEGTLNPVFRTNEAPLA